MFLHKFSLNRRRFLELGAISAASSLVATPWLATNAAHAAQDSPRRYRKAVKIGMVKVDGSLTEKFALLKELGFDGVELDSPGGPTPDEVARAKDESGLIVHGVVDSVHWQQRLSDSDPEVRAAGVAALRTAIQMAKQYGATSVLLVPGRVTEDASYKQCWDRSTEEIKKVVPLAEKEDIHILIENVWNDFLTDPEEMARYLDQFDSPKLGAYFDVGNAVRYAPPPQWVRVLGPRIVKLDIKEFDLDKASVGPVGSGFDVELLEGDCRWPEVLEELAKLNYSGWGTAEIPGGDRERLAEIAMRMDRIFALAPDA